MSSHTTPCLLLFSPFSCTLPPPPPPPPVPSHTLGISFPVSTISDQLKSLASAPSYLRVPKFSASQCISRPCSDYLRCKPLSPQILLHLLLTPVVGIPSPPHHISLVVSPLFTIISHVRILPGTVPYGVVITHVSDPKSSTAYITAFKNNPNTLGLAPSHHMILVRRAQLLCAFLRLSITTDC